MLKNDWLRRRYAGGRGDWIARRMARVLAAAYATGWCGQRWVTLEVTGRSSGRTRRFPLGTADLDGRRYLVSMLGEDCHWVRNVRAAGGHATLRHGRARPCLLVEVPSGQRVPILRSYLRTVPGARPHIPVSAGAPDAELAAVAGRYPVFRVESLE